MATSNVDELEAIDALKRFYETGEKKDLQFFYKYFFLFTYRTALYHVQNADDADDICQSVYLEILTSNSKCDGAYTGIPNKVKAWLGGIVLNKAKSLFRQNKSMKNRIDKRKQLNEINSNANEDEKKGLIEILDNAIKSLPKKYRIPIMLRYKEDLSFADISVMLNVKPATVRSQISRGLSFLRHQLGKQKTAISTFVLLKLIGHIKMEAASEEVFEKCISVQQISAHSKVVSINKFFLSVINLKFLALFLGMVVIICVGYYYEEISIIYRSFSNIDAINQKSSWDFEFEDGNDIHVVAGSWSLSKKDKVMILEKGNEMFKGKLPYIYTKPLVVKMKGKIDKINSEGVINSIVMPDLKATIFYSNEKTIRLNLEKNAPILVNLYLFNNYLFYTNSYSTGFVILNFERSARDENLFLFLKNFGLKEFKLSPLNKQDLKDLNIKVNEIKGYENQKSILQKNIFEIMGDGYKQ